MKELVENALDAGAARSHVEIEGGRQDAHPRARRRPGHGREDAELALERHATSKLRELGRPAGHRHARLSRRGAALDRQRVRLRAADARRRGRGGHRGRDRARPPRARAGRRPSRGAPRSRCGTCSGRCRRGGSSCARTPRRRATWPRRSACSRWPGPHGFFLRSGGRPRDRGPARRDAWGRALYQLFGGALARGPRGGGRRGGVGAGVRASCRGRTGSGRPGRPCASS